MTQILSLPHWTIGDPLPATGNAEADRALNRRFVELQECLESLVAQTSKQIEDALYHSSQEALAEVTTTSGTYVELSGGPEITIATRPGLMIAVLLDVEAKTTAGSAFCAAALDGGTTLGESNTGSATYVRLLSGPLGGGTYPDGRLAVFPATATSHTLTMVYKTTAGTASFQNRRIWAFNL
jgi:hypothetical protein